MDNSKISREQKIEFYDKLVASHPGAIRKGATIPYTSLNGHMYSYFSKDDFVALRLPEDQRIKFLDKYKTTLVEQYGIVQREYVRVPDSLLKKTNELNQYFDISYEYVSTLKPKATATTKKKK